MKEQKKRLYAKIVAKAWADEAYLWKNVRNGCCFPLPSMCVRRTWIPMSWLYLRVPSKVRIHSVPLKIPQSEVKPLFAYALLGGFFTLVFYILPLAYCVYLLFFTTDSGWVKFSWAMFLSLILLFNVFRMLVLKWDNIRHQRYNLTRMWFPSLKWSHNSSLFLSPSFLILSCCHSEGSFLPPWWQMSANAVGSSKRCGWVGEKMQTCAYYQR